MLLFTHSQRPYYKTPSTHSMIRTSEWILHSTYERQRSSVTLSLASPPGFLSIKVHGEMLGYVDHILGATSWQRQILIMKFIHKSSLILRDGAYFPSIVMSEVGCLPMITQRSVQFIWGNYTVIPHAARPGQHSAKWWQVESNICLKSFRQWTSLHSVYPFTPDIQWHYHWICMQTPKFSTMAIHSWAWRLCFLPLSCVLNHFFQWSSINLVKPRECKCPCRHVRLIDYATLICREDCPSCYY